MDEMEEYEIKDAVENLSYYEKNDWERTRLNIYSSVQMNTKKKLKPEDVLKFPWEVEPKVKDTNISNEDIERLREKSKIISQTLNGK